MNQDGQADLTRSNSSDMEILTLLCELYKIAQMCRDRNLSRQLASIQADISLLQELQG